MVARRGCAGFSFDLDIASGRQIKQEGESSSCKGLDHVPGVTHAMCIHTHMSIPMGTYVQADDFFPDSNKALTTTVPKPPAVCGCPPPAPYLPLPSPAWHDQHKAGHLWIEKESHSPFNAFQEPTESHALQTSQGCTARRSGCGRKDRQAEG